MVLNKENLEWILSLVISIKLNNSVVYILKYIFFWNDTSQGRNVSQPPEAKYTILWGKSWAQPSNLDEGTPLSGS